MRDGFVFYRSVRDAIRCLPNELQLDAYNAVMDYALDGAEPTVTGIALAIFVAVKPQIDANNERYENGKKGGRMDHSQESRHRKVQVCERC